MIVNTFIPKYMEKFKCIGSECTDTCCAGWDINIDENSLERYKNSTGALKSLVEGKFLTDDKKGDFFNAGYMILKDGSRCPFLNENMLCDIHGAVGEENLCITCKSYPRVFNIVDGIYEKSALASCEEICRLALMNKEKMEFVEAEEELDEDNIEIRRIIDTEAFAGTESLIQYFWEIRILSINIIQCSEYSIDERLSILKRFYSKIDSLKLEGDWEGLEEFFEDYSKGIFNYQEYIKVSLKVDERFSAIIGDNDIIKKIRSPRLKKYAEDYRNNILLDRNKDLYNDITEKIEEILKDYAYVMENYLVNQIFKDLIPFNKGEDMMASVNVLINTYKLIKEYLKGRIYKSKERIMAEDVVSVIQAISKDLEHNKVLNKIINYKA
ncbi:flagellin lysine-N-methylase [uncultured Clostridium sp.]|uniref:flagellin lysine-N-methylase n=1 Tax=uncultured Clostridium sp. TaxID=59620 RepID=UPI002671CA3E|nr:flagellin lysine-N-methylase [uncultured Clostridium sp.]